MVPVAGRGAIDRGVVADDELPVGRGVHVELDPRGAGGHRPVDGEKGRRGRFPRAALVRIGDAAVCSSHTDRSLTDAIVTVDRR